jgi:tetratricopeptide (TPR) repeat protein
MKTAADEGFDSITSSLRADWGLNHLLQALSLSEKFEFHILVCDTPRVAQAIRAILETDSPGRVVWLTPSRSERDAREPARFEDVAAVLDLAVPGERQGDEPQITVIDASVATEKDEPAWRELFRRMNERRNVLARLLSGPLVLCVPPRLEVAFAHEAPDFWSIRSTSITVSPTLVSASSQGSTREVELAFRGEERPWSIEERERLRAAVEAARQRVAGDPEDRSAQANLAVQLQRLGRLEEEHGTLQRAADAYEEALQLQRHFIQLDPEREDWLSDYAVILVDVGDAQRARGDLLGAQSSYEESLEIRRRLLERDPGRPEWLRGLSVSLDRIGDVQRARGDLLGAQSSYEESLEVMRRLLERDPGRPEWLRDLSVSLERIGDVQSARGDLLGAQSSYEESLEVRRRLLERDPDRPEWLRDLVLSLMRIGVVEAEQGDLAKALSAYREAEEVTQDLQSRYPEQPATFKDVPSLIASRIAELEEALRT